MSDIVLLRELMETRYITNAHVDDFYRALKVCKDNDFICDISMCRFGPFAVAVMTNEFKNVKFINREEPELNKILENNREFFEAEYAKYPPLSIPSDVKLDWVVNAINELQPGQYEPDIASENIYQRAALCLLIMARPDIEFDIRKYGLDVFTFVRGAWLREPQHHESYYELVAPNILRQDISEDGFYGDKTGRKMQERDYIHTKVVLPIEFGNTQIVRLGETPDKEWYPVVSKCVEYLNKDVTVQRRRGRVCRNYLTFRGDENND